MAEAVVISIAEDIVGYLVPRALDYVGKFCGVKREIEVLKERVLTLQDELDDAEEKYYQNQNPQNRQIRVWLQNVKDAFYEAQDVLEEFDIEAIRRDLRGRYGMCEEVRTFFSSSNQLAFKLKMTCQIRAVSVRIEAIETNRKFPLDNRPKREWRNREETHSFIPGKDIIGREVDKKNVMDFLLDSNFEENVSILPIVGIGGVGKTALAQYVYGESKFDLKMWVCVSTDFDVKKIVKQMLACIKRKKTKKDAMELLQSKLRKKINGKKYLLVLDDVWDSYDGQNIEQKWQSLKSLLEEGARGSKILVTTRFLSVEKIMVTTPPYELQGLSEGASLDLLIQMAGQKKEEIQNFDMLAIVKEIVRKCIGVPLVVRTVGRLLFDKPKHEWSRFKDDELPEVTTSKDSIISVLKLSYNHLPSHLKQCFALCSLFPKDYEIKKQTLIDLWIAEGFIQSSNRKHLEDIAHKYFMDLLWSNFFQDLKDPYMREETCKMHDFMHDLACLVAGKECWVAGDDTESINERTRHISYGSTFDLMGKLPISRLKASALRTILSTTRYWKEREQIEQGEPTSEANLHKLIQSFKRLRILDLHGIKVEKVPQSICKLKHLTYLDFSDNHTLKRLPNSITRLQSLQTLNLNGCYSLEELPSDIRNLVSLRNLNIDGCLLLSYLPRGLGELSSLRRLTRFILSKDETCAKNYCGLGELSGLNNLRGSLVIENLRYVTNAEAESKDAKLIEKHSLESLALDWGDLDLDYLDTDDDNAEIGNRESLAHDRGDLDTDDAEIGNRESLALDRGDLDTDDAEIGNRDEALLNGLRPSSYLHMLIIKKYEGESFPRWMMENLRSSLPNLVEVHFYDCERCRSLPPLGQLRHLKRLRMWGLTELKCIESDHSSTLTSFHSLSKLEIYECEKLEAMPPTPHLEELDLLAANAKLLNRMLGLNKLKRLDIVGMRTLKCLPEECLESLTSLESLRIRDCDRLTSLSQGMRHLMSLVDLSIGQCKKLDIFKDESGSLLDFHGLQSLRSAEIFHLPKLASLPQWLLHAVNLERLHIWECRNLKDIPEQIEDLRLLQRLEFRWCHSLTSLPEGMRGLASLTDLILVDCGKLNKRCKRDVGEDWDKIADIPHIFMNP